ncbi:sulfoxide reductase heme-binding subunit YedZ [Denitratisoma sp. DHT3]|uniref:sulfite oxidase heme-binding subunit YedZ n=1 Tax=Denitratisoma sp. DHT3 TaxID=1981880 RepID=UPI0011988798|nr:protein-methionine-sulfoxide reductase heme-binding subunit MsrQ [Denitratisoma sp. DHT3]QDX81697.1 sulfoxide reductase heme-binding subunit YedZ [Denitratisoma sp. DHT3]
MKAASVKNPSATTIAAVKAGLFLVCLLPLAHLGWGAWQDDLGANPIEFVTRGLGTWTLNFLLITLTVTPLRRLSGWHWLLRLRRMLGLFVFFYACLHLTSYLWWDQFFDWHAIGKDIVKRPFITVGMAAFLLTAALALTSNAWAIRRLGGRRWQELHRSIYAIAILAVLHYSWLVKKDLFLPVLYFALVALLLGMRAYWRNQERQAQLAGKYLHPRRGRVIPIMVKPGRLHE